MGQSFSIPLHPVPSMNRDHASSPTLGTGYSQMGMDQGRRSFVSFQNCRTSKPLSTAQVPFSSNTSTIQDHFSNDNPSPSKVYNDLSTSTNNISPNAYEPVYTSDVALDCTLSSWSSDGIDNCMNNINNFTSQVSGSNAYFYLHDGLATQQDEQEHDIEGLGIHTYEPANNWPSNPYIPGTVRPKALNLNASFESTASMSTTASSTKSTYSSSSDSTAVANSAEDTSNKRQSVLEQPHPRYVLPSSEPTKNNEAALHGPSNHDVVPARTNESQWDKNIPVKHRRMRASSPIISAVANTRSHTIIKKDLDIGDCSVPKTHQHDVPEGKSSPAIDVTKIHSRSEQNKFLVSSRLHGLSYKEIRSKGGFSDAESTLRGRFRRLTKDKKDRVRKPEWTDIDLRLLAKAVKKIARSNRKGWEPKVAWKKVAEYIADNGGSYRFGYATCRKRWLKIKDLD
ncbi:hypothetical protein DSL72_000040 [Monilinia vaccinii-corymbosi]|uniref:Myb-like domain-containing protein n=1 Tax=Monilinia vaccinii-corymbosi TaxID=61207 RepID=A0A8A3P535_9HELO|nr:hypothetical protein DSL72_000040 [Monilinia vaccinii-corymbosi]